MESGNGEDRAGCGGWSHSSWEKGVGINGGGKTAEQVGREEQDLLSEKLNVRCLWSSTWKCGRGAVG